MIDDVAQQKIREAYEKTVLNEARTDEALSMELNRVIDNFARYLIGDRKNAIRELEKLIKTSVPFPQKSTDEYNKMFNSLYSDIKKAVEKNIK